MRHNRKEVLERITREYERLDALVAHLTNEQWNRSLQRPESKDPWTVKDALAHITYWKERGVHAARRQPQPAEMRGLNATQANHVIFLRWHARSPQEVLEWHRQVQQEALKALQEAPEKWFDRERGPDWPFDMDGHSAEHRVKDIERALKS